MKKKLMALVAIAGVVIGSTIYAVESSPLVTQVAQFDVFWNEQKVETEKPILVVDGETYFPITEVSDLLGVKTNWNSTKECLEITKNNVAEEVNDYNASNGLELTSIWPNDGQQNAYLKWGYLTLTFNENIVKVDNVGQIDLIDENGEKIAIKGAYPGISAEDNLIIIPEKDLQLDTNYKLTIPQNTIQSKSGKDFEKEIMIDFKTATNAVKGTIESSETYFGKNITLKNENDTFNTRIVGKNEFMFVDIPEGKYEVLLEEQGETLVKSTITVENGKVNEFIID